MTWLEIFVYILLGAFLCLAIVNIIIQIMINIKQYNHAAKLEKAIKSLDDIVGESFKDITRNEFFKDIEELKNKDDEQKGE